MTKWSARGTGNPAGPGLESRSGHLLDLFSVVPILNPRPCQVLNRKLFVFCSFEGLNISAADCTHLSLPVLVAKHTFDSGCLTSICRDPFL